LAAKCGYQLKGRVRNGYRAPDGQVVDLLVYALAPDDWRALPPLPREPRRDSSAD
jgi:RimJ/RimL family protein N-acetyltransferase